MPFCRSTRAPYRTVAASIAALLALTFPVLAHAALTGAAFDEQIARIKGLERTQLREGMHHVLEARERASERAERATPGSARHARAARKRARTPHRRRRATIVPTRSERQRLPRPIPPQHGHR